MPPLYNNSFTSRSFVKPPVPNVFHVGVDVGTGLARACVIDTSGAILGLAERPIHRQELKALHITQLLTEIWEAICYCVRLAVRDLGVDPAFVYGLGFDATCLLVVLSSTDDAPVAVGPDFNNADQNIVLWMDHRAEAETDAINATGDVCLKYVGGQMLVEMELPKIKWLKHHVSPETFADMKFYDLADFLTHRATGSEARSFCLLVCKQGFVPVGVEGSTTGWNAEFLKQIDLPELVEDDFRRLGGLPATGATFLTAGAVVGTLLAKAADELGLTTQVVVGLGVIDAYAGWVGTVAARTDVAVAGLEGTAPGIARACGRLAAVAGTLTCHIAMTPDAVFVPGVWGPYRDVMAPGFWLAEGGQSCTGALLAHVLLTHPAYGELASASDSTGLSKFDFLNSRLELMVRERGARLVVALGKHLFFYGDFHGNRSPVADLRMRAAIVGQLMDHLLDDLALQYFGACEFIAQQTRQIVEAMVEAGHQLLCIYLSGGQCRNGLLMRLLADCTGLPIVIPRYIDAAVVFGAALLGAAASEQHPRGTRPRRLLLAAEVSAREALGPPSPYTAPSATALHTMISEMAPPAGGFPFPVMTPVGEEQGEAAGGYFDKPARGEDESSDEEELTFGTEKTLEKVLARHVAAPTSSGDRLWRIMEKMSGAGRVVLPLAPSHPDRRLLAAKYKVFLDLCVRQQEYRKEVDAVEAAIAAEAA